MFNRQQERFTVYLGEQVGLGRESRLIFFPKVDRPLYPIEPNTSKI
ncbi:hypothetical protein [Microcoleus sp. CAWBG50]|nr:hypothetical protein [Microcoleus sp. CAWBG50]